LRAPQPLIEPRGLFWGFHSPKTPSKNNVPGGLTGSQKCDRVKLSASDRGEMAKITATVEIEDLYDVDEAADLLGKGVATIWRRIRDNKIIVVRIAGRTLIPKSEIERLKNEKATKEKTTSVA